MQRYKDYKRVLWTTIWQYNLEDMDRFLEKFNLPRLSQEKIEIVKNPMTSTDIEAVIKNLP